MKIAILCPDTFPLIIDKPDKNTKNKCCAAGALGKRAYQIIKDISEKFTNNDIDVYIPHYNFPTEKIEGPYFTDTHINYISYNFKKGLKIEDLVNYNYPVNEKDVLNLQYKDNQVKKYDYIYIQTTTGVNFKVVSRILKKVKTKVIVDAWVPFLQEQDINLQRYGSKGNKKYIQYKKDYDYLMARADIILYDNEPQLNYIEGYLQGLGLRANDVKLTKYKYSPYITNSSIKFYDKSKKRTIRNLLWYGPIYPWYSIDSISLFVMLHKKFNLLFYGVRHPRYINYYDSTIRGELVSYCQFCSNIALIEDFKSSKEENEILSSSDAVIILDNGGIESKYSVRVRIIDLLAKGIIVITNSKLDDINLKDGLYKIDNDFLSLYNILHSKLLFSKESYNQFMEIYVNNSIQNIIEG